MIELMAVAAFAISIFLYPRYISWAKKRQFGQYVRQEGPDLHNYKQGTPTAGGMLFVIIIFLLNIAVYVYNGEPIHLIVALSSVGFGSIGFMDDITKILKKQSMGLSAPQKLIMQFAVSFLVYLLISFFNNHTQMLIPFTMKKLDLGIFYVVWVMVYMTGMSNASNLTDGLDGLAAGVYVISALLTVLISGLDISLAFTIIFPVLAYMIFNIKPAKVFMGDTGSLALGGIIASIAVYTGTELFTLFTCFIFLSEMFSVIIQVGSFKLRKGKRVFLMAPIHHHFELLGWHEERVVMNFWIFNIIAGLIALGGR